jgi:hypothetical protein
MAQMTTNLKVMVFNAENLFLLSDQQLTTEHLKLDETRWQKLSTSVFENKPLYKCRAIASIINETQPDLILLCEVGGHESLANFNRLFLDDRYSPALVEGNSDRNIDLGYLIRKDIGFYFDIVSNKNRAINYLYPHERQSSLGETAATIISKPSSHKFSRDVAELHLFSRNRENPFLIFLLTHLKSRLDPDGIDPNGFERRQAELQALIEIYLEHEAKHGHQIPIAIAGDFNGNARFNQSDREFAQIYEMTQLRDVCELAALKEEHRITYFQVGRSSRPEGKQIDFCFLSPQLAQYLALESVQVYQYKDHQGIPFDPPTTLDAKMSLPSDHYPLIFSLKDIPIY